MCIKSKHFSDHLIKGGFTTIFHYVVKDGMWVDMRSVDIEAELKAFREACKTPIEFTWDFNLRKKEDV
jgi:hypothetical protein